MGRRSICVLGLLWVGGCGEQAATGKAPAQGAVEDTPQFLNDDAAPADDAWQLAVFSRISAAEYAFRVRGGVAEAFNR